jgi:WD40 repeat protein
MRIAWLLLGVGCATASTPPAVLRQVREASARSWLTGAPAALAQQQVLNREDFVYDARPSPDGQRVAVSRLDVGGYFLSVHELGPTPQKRIVDVNVGPLEFDVEALDFTADGQRIVAVSRDGQVRLYDATSGQLLRRWLVEEPLASVAVSPDGDWLAVGSSLGLVTVLRADTLAFVAESRVHVDEVRGLVAAANNRLYSGGWDRRIAALEVVAAPAPAEVRTRFERKNGVAAIRVGFDRLALGSAALDERLEGVAISPALAASLGLVVNALKETTTVLTATGPQVVKVARGRTLVVKGLIVEGVDVVVCEACVAPGLLATLGRSFSGKVSVAFDESSQEVVLAPVEGAAGVRLEATRSLVTRAQFDMPGAVNDLSVDRRGAVLGVALSEAKAQRTKEVYEREKKGLVEPERPFDAAARVSTADGQLLEVRHGHRGVVSTVGVSPDGAFLVSAGWDRRLLLHRQPGQSPHAEKLGYPPRRARFTADGTRVVVASWTPVNPLGDHASSPAAMVFEVVMPDASVMRGP